jgi:regulatory subunit for Cdc7p protein kinase
MDRKRSLTRLPLMETSGNVPLPVVKRARLATASARPADRRVLHDTTNNHVTHPPKLGVAPPQATMEPVDGADSVTSAATTQTAKSAAPRTTRLVGDELLLWQASWRRIMKESTVYFDTQGCDASNAVQQTEQRRVHRALRLVGCHVAPFFERDVTIIVSRRPFQAGQKYASSDIFHDAVNQRIKVWNYDKAFRFLRNLGAINADGGVVAAGADGADAGTGSIGAGELYNLLKEEKIFGTNDRDPLARRDDLHYLEKNYLYAYDLSQTIRPIAVREWYDASYPVLGLTLDGKCPFIADPSGDQNSERRRLRRAQKFEATKAYRASLKEATANIMGVASRSSLRLTALALPATALNPISETGQTTTNAADSGDRTTSVSTEEDDARARDPPTKYEFKRPPLAPPTLARQLSVMPQDSNSRYFEVAASGFNGASNAAQCLLDSAGGATAHGGTGVAAAAGNGLGPSVSQVPSKNINNLKRRIFMKRQREKTKPSQPNSKDRELKPGYCENCRAKYDHFEDHVMTSRHRTFACDDANFRDIDELIATLNESKSLGVLASNGDYRYV